MAFTLDEALSKIGTAGYTGVDGLRRLVSETSAVASNLVAVSDATVLLYSKDVSGIPAWQLAEAASNSSINNGLKQVVTIADTAVGQLLTRDVFKNVLMETVGGNEQTYNLIMDGKDATGTTRVSSASFWDDASRNLASSATGNIITFSPNAAADSVFAQTEIDAALNSNAPTINGIPREDLVRLRSDVLNSASTITPEHIDYTNRVVFDAINTASAEQARALSIATDVTGKNLLGVGTTDYFNQVGLTGAGSDLPAGMVGNPPSMPQTRETIVNAQLANEHYRQYGQERFTLAEAAGDAAKTAAAAKYLDKLGIIGDALALGLIAFDANAAYTNGDTAGAEQIIKNGLLDFAGGLAGGLAAAQLVGSALLPLYVMGPAGAIIAGGLTLLAGIAGGIGGEVIAHQIADLFSAARNWVPRYDPLTLDLDGDSLETVGIDPLNPILFDHDGDGIKNATGWIKPDDGFLVLDRNGNGTIDNGAELFGDSTPAYAGGSTADGFAALAQEDSNGDGLVNASDAHWNELRVWQDANSDGISQQGELKTLESLNITGFHVAKTENSTRLANGNQIADLGAFIKADGSEGTVGQITGGMADIDLAANPFYRSFPDTIPLTPQAQALPDMQGSGMVRDLSEAVSINPVLGTALADYAAAGTKAGQLARIDAVISQWAASSSFQTSIEKATAQGDLMLFLVPGLTPYDVLGAEFGLSSGSGSSGTGIAPPTPKQIAQLDALKAQQIHITEILGYLEKFNGLNFVNVEPQGVRTGANAFLTSSGSSSSGTSSVSVGGDLFVLTLSAAQLQFIESAYESLRQSVYDGLLLQTRLKPYFDAITLNLTADGISVDVSGINVALDTLKTTDFKNALLDLIDLNRVSGQTLYPMGWSGAEKLDTWVEQAALDPAMLPVLQSFATATEGRDVLLGQAGNDVLNGLGNGARDAANDAVFEVRRAG